MFACALAKETCISSRTRSKRGTLALMLDNMFRDRRHRTVVCVLSEREEPISSLVENVVAPSHYTKKFCELRRIDNTDPPVDQSRFACAVRKLKSVELDVLVKEGEDMHRRTVIHHAPTGCRCVW